MILGMRADILKGHLDLLLLTVVSEGSKHGYAIVEELRERSGEVFDLPEGTVYPALHRLERAGLLRSEWTTASGRRRRVYSLTHDGRSAIVRRRREWHEFSTAMAHVMEVGPWAQPT
jgi:PadR family transcriptional regulator, regulatory protein PadR